MIRSTGDNLKIPYGVAEKKRFDALFSGLEIAKAPTSNKNRYQVLAMGFSQVNRWAGLSLQERFEAYIGACSMISRRDMGISTTKIWQRDSESLWLRRNSRRSPWPHGGGATTST